MTIFRNYGDDARLHCVTVADPERVVITNPAEAPTQRTNTFYFQIDTPRPETVPQYVYCRKIVIKIPSGEGETDLTDGPIGPISSQRPPEGIGTPGYSWRMDKTSDSNSMFVWTCTPEGDDDLPPKVARFPGDRACVFTIGPVKINSEAGTAEIVLEEETATSPNGQFETRTSRIPIEKQDGSFFLRNFRPEYSLIERGTSPTLIWEAGTASLTMFQDNHVFGENSPNRPRTPPWTSPIPIDDSTTFTLLAETQRGTRKIQEILTTIVKVKEPNINAHNLTTTGSSLISTGGAINFTAHALNVAFYNLDNILDGKDTTFALSAISKPLQNASITINLSRPSQAGRVRITHGDPTGNARIQFGVVEYLPVGTQDWITLGAITNQMAVFDELIEQDVNPIQSVRVRLQDGQSSDFEIRTVKIQVPEPLPSGRALFGAAGIAITSPCTITGPLTAEDVRYIGASDLRISASKDLHIDASDDLRISASKDLHIEASSNDLIGDLNVKASNLAFSGKCGLLRPHQVIKAAVQPGEGWISAVAPSDGMASLSTSDITVHARVTRGIIPPYTVVLNWYERTGWLPVERGERIQFQHVWDQPAGLARTVSIDWVPIGSDEGILFDQ
ncbi:hypothetical protein [Streptomyces sp. x-19]|uniref:hypothetical protein n=1 Tax=Streptomyces sp. x-19 TaxID=2789280 RepID=UPI00397F3563